MKSFLPWVLQLQTEEEGKGKEGEESCRKREMEKSHMQAELPRVCAGKQSKVGTLAVPLTRRNVETCLFKTACSTTWGTALLSQKMELQYRQTNAAVRSWVETLP
jgi:hypothetical protein